MIFHCLYWTEFSDNTTTCLWSSFFKTCPDICGKTTFWVFRGLGSVSGSCFYSELRIANVCAEVGETAIKSTFNCGIFANTFFSQFRLEKGVCFYGCRNKFHINQRSLCFSNSTLIFCKSICWIQRLCLAVLARSYLKVAWMFGGQTFSPASFWNYLKTKGFRRASVILLQLFGLLSCIWLPIIN